MTFEDAIAADRDGRLLDAAGLYEGLLASKLHSLEVFLNLVVLYWQITDFGFWTAKGLSEEFVKRAGNRLQDLLNKDFKKYQDSAEVTFWKRYILWTDLGEPFSTADCVMLLESDESVIVPVMFLFAESEGKQWREQALELLDQCRANGTTRAQYVQSVIEGVLKRSK